MGYTNKTSHYELPQYVANDKPSWLGDFNAAMLKIDTVMADNDATAEAANSAATGAQTQVAALSSQLSTIQGQVNTAVDTATTADGKATTAQTVATQANTAAGEAKTMAETAKQSADLALPIGGGTMTGTLTLAGDPVTGLQAATKNYVDSKVVQLTGERVIFENTDNFSGQIDVRKYTNGLICCAFGGTLAASVTVTAFKIALGTISDNPFNLETGATKTCGHAVVDGSSVRDVIIGFDGVTTLYLSGSATYAGKSIVCISTEIAR